MRSHSFSSINIRIFPIIPYLAVKVKDFLKKFGFFFKRRLRSDLSPTERGGVFSLVHNQVNVQAGYHHDRKYCFCKAS